MSLFFVMSCFVLLILFTALVLYRDLLGSIPVLWAICGVVVLLLGASAGFRWSLELERAVFIVSTVCFFQTAATIVVLIRSSAKNEGGIRG